MPLITQLLSPEQASGLLRLALELESQAKSGLDTAGSWSRDVKRNRQLVEGAPDELVMPIVQAIGRSNEVRRSCLPSDVTRPLVSFYREGDRYGRHADSPLQSGIRADVSFTCFLADPATYEGGELVLALEGGERRVKLTPGQAVFYASGTIHWVEPVRDGCRIAAVGWIRSHVPDPATRDALADFSRTVDELRSAGAPEAPLVRLTELYSVFTRAAMR